MGCCSTKGATATDGTRNTPLASLNSPTPGQCAFEPESQSSPRSPPLPQSTEHQQLIPSETKKKNNTKLSPQLHPVQGSIAGDPGITIPPLSINADLTQQPLPLEAPASYEDASVDHRWEREASPIDHTYSNPLGLPVELMYQSANHHGQMQDMYSQQGTSTPPSRSYNSGELLHASTDALAAGLGFSPSPLMAVLSRDVREQEADRTVLLP